VDVSGVVTSSPAGWTPSPSPTDQGSTPSIAWLHHPGSLDPGLVGAKAANLARARVGGLPVMAGFAITTVATTGGVLDPAALDDVRRAWQELTRTERVLIVRSSSTVEDTSTSSMAGQFTSILGVEGWEAFLAALHEVLRSSVNPNDGSSAAQPMGVLVQPELRVDAGGVLFGLDPVTGDRRHVIVEAVRGTPDALVSGTVTATHCVLGWRGRIVGGRPRDPDGLLGRSRRGRLVRLARRAAEVFEGPQDVEWAFDADDRLWMLQSRAITASGDDRATGPVLGPGPVAEMFPEPLHPIEVDLWIDPLREAVEGALHVTGAVSRRRIDASPVVAVVGGRVAVDLELFGIVPPDRGLFRVLNPAPGLRRLLAAWRVGRLRGAMPGLARDVVAHADAELTALGDLSGYGDVELVELLERARRELVTLHGYEILAGMLLPPEPHRPSLAGVALAALTAGRREGLRDAELTSRYPVVLGLVPPAVSRQALLPDVARGGGSNPGGIPELSSREALRLRCRWVQELSACAVAELGRRLESRGLVTTAEEVRDLTLDRLRRTVATGRTLEDTSSRDPFAAPLPMAFRLGPAAAPVPVTPRRSSARPDGLPASAGRGSGTACHRPEAIVDAAGTVLVVDALEPRLAAVLPSLAGLVSESGSALSHLAILAREMGVPTVVAVPDARRRFPEGCRLLVDGTTGEVRVLDEGGAS
jgi:rifampicin phosphotransferase